MKEYSLLVLFAFCNGQFPAVHQKIVLCQQWCYKYDIYGAIYLRCCDFEVRHGSCPKGCLFGYGANVNNIRCNCDENCPIGYKCCSDSCSYFQKICKPIAYNMICEYPETTPKLQPECTTEKNTTPTTEKNEPPTLGITNDDDDYDYDGSGSGSEELSEEITTYKHEVTTTTIKPTTTTKVVTTTILDTTIPTETTLEEETTTIRQETTTAEMETTLEQETTENEEDTTVPTTTEFVVVVTTEEEGSTIFEDPTTIDDYDIGSGEVLPTLADQPYPNDDDDFTFEL